MNPYGCYLLDHWTRCAGYERCPLYALCHKEAGLDEAIKRKK